MKRNLRTVLSTLAAFSLIGAVLPALAADAVTLKDASSPNTAATAAVMTVSFRPQNGANGYSIIATGEGVTTQRGSTAVCDDTTCTSYLTGLTGGTNYTVEVRWINSSGVSAVVGTSTKNAVSIPGAPNAISATSTGTSVALTWALPSNSGGLPLSACTITGGPSVVPVAGTATTKTIDNLTPGLQYSMAITCKNDNGASAPSAFTAFTVKTAPSAPAKPAVAVAGTSLTVGWVAPSSNGADISGYSVYVVDSSGSDVGTATSAAAGSTSAVVSLASVADGTYTVQVLATNAIGSSARSPKSNSFTIGTVATPTPTATPSSTPSASASPSSTPSASPTFGGGGGGGGGGAPAPTPAPIVTGTPSAPPVVIAPKPSPTPTKTTAAPTPVVTVKAVPGLTAGSTKITATAQAALNSQAKSLIAGKAKQVTLTIATKGTTLVKAKAQAAAVAKALAKAGVTATVKVTGTGAKAVVTVVATKKKK
jgi:hypothetical protein